MIFSEIQVAPLGEKELDAYNTNNYLATSMIFYIFSNEILLMISSSNFAKKASDKLKSIYLTTKFSKRLTILQKLLQSRQEENKSV